MAVDTLTRPAAVAPVPAQPARWRGAGPHLLGLLAALGSLTLLGWGLGRPALWMDETASVVAAQRSWPNLWHLMNGNDAPLVAYYAVLKWLTEAVTGVAPGAAAHPEVLYRWPSLLVVCLAIWALTVWLARRSPPLAICTAVFVLASVGTSRYAQEARPYAFALAAAVLASLLWSRMVADRRRRWPVLYALALVLLVGAHLLAGSLVIAHLVTALVGTTRGRRWRSAGRTAVGAILAAAVVAPYAIPAALHGNGPSRPRTLSAQNLLDTFVHLFTYSSSPMLAIGPILLLALVGLTQVFRGEHQAIARLAAGWGLVPPVVLLPLVLDRSNLMMGRYLVFVLPAWAILAGLGVLTLAAGARTVVRWALERLARRAGLVARPEPAGRIVAGLLAVAILVTIGVVQYGSLRIVRRPDGHGEDSRRAMAALDRGRNDWLPVLVSARAVPMALAVYGRADEGRLLGVHPQRDQGDIWPVFDDATRRIELLRANPRILLLQKGETGCRPEVGVPPADYVSRCMPWPLAAMGYRVVSARTTGHDWTVAVLDRSPVLDRVVGGRG